MNEINMSDGFKEMFDNLSKYNINRHDEDKPLYKYVSIETAKIIVGNGTIKFSTPLELNDNDLDVSLLDSNVDENIQNKIIIQILKKNLDPQFAAFMEAQLQNPSINIPNDEFVREVIKGYESERNKFGIFCLTTDHKSEFMWNKYAEQGKGVCLEFQFPTLYSEQFYTFTVAYNSEFKPSKLFNEDGTVNSLSVNRWLFTKHRRYAPENEVRMVTEKLIGIHPFPRKFLTRIFYGPGTSEQDKITLERLLENGEYNFNHGTMILKTLWYSFITSIYRLGVYNAHSKKRLTPKIFGNRLLSVVTLCCRIISQFYIIQKHNDMFASVPEKN